MNPRGPTTLSTLYKSEGIHRLKRVLLGYSVYSKLPVPLSNDWPGDVGIRIGPRSHTGVVRYLVEVIHQVSKPKSEHHIPDSLVMAIPMVGSPIPEFILTIWLVVMLLMLNGG